MQDKIDPKDIAENQNETTSDGSTIYPVDGDIYSMDREAENIDPENPEHDKQPADPEGSGDANEKDFADDESGNDLDVPGAELDDELEAIGSEDEENNLYNMGGDDHNDLDEVKD